MYVLHTMPDTAGLAVHLMLVEMGLPFSLRIIDRNNGERDAPGYRAMHPLGLSPSLDTPDGPIFETAAVLLWLADRHGAMAPAPQSPERAPFLKWHFFTSTNLHPALMQLYYPDRWTGDPAATPAFLRAATDRLALYLGLLDAAVAAGPDWCPPDAPSAMGLYLSMLLRWVGQAEPEHPAALDRGAYPALLRIARALEERPAARHVAKVEGLGPTIFSAPTP
jgi:glutathione S-transferase